MAQRVAGICYIKVDGAQLTVEGGVEAPMNTVNREAVMGLAGQAGYKETSLEQYLKVSAIFTPDFPLQTIAQGTNMTITAELANGKVYTLSGAYLRGERPVKGDEGKTDLEFSGTSGVWR